MWTRRKLIDFKRLDATADEATQVTSTFTAQHASTETLAGLAVEKDAFNCVASLAYTLIPQITAAESVALSQWCLQRWVADGTSRAQLQSAFASTSLLRQSFNQVEYFFTGTDNGQLFIVPLMPPHLADAAIAWEDSARAATPDAPNTHAQTALFSQLRALRSTPTTVSSALPFNCGPRRLVHQHAREEPVTALDHVGTLVVSGSDDRSIALSFFHPVLTPIVTMVQPSPIRYLKLWEGSAFLRDAAQQVDKAVEVGSTAASEESPHAEALRVWRGAVRDKEAAAVYLFVGDESAVVRLWRVDVQTRDYVLLHVFVCTTHTRPVHSALDMLAREDPKRPAISRETGQSIHCLAIDGDARLIAGSEEGLYVWDLSRLSWKPSDDAVETHPLCWDETLGCPLSISTATTPASQLATVRMRASRLVNLHVVVRGADFVRAQLNARDASTQPAAGPGKVSTWKPKYGRAMTSGAAIGTVTNAVYIPASVDATTALLTESTVSLTFEDNELNNDVRLPLSCVEPVVYPLCYLPTYRSSCFAVDVLQANRRLISSGSNGSIVLWSWAADEERYVPTVVAGRERQMFRGLGRRLCVLRSPDVFVSCGYDDGLVKEWHVYDEPELLVRCERRFTMMPESGYARAGRGGAAGGSGQSTSEADAARQAADAMKQLVSGPHDGAKKKATSDASEGDESTDDEADQDPDVLKQGGEVVAGISCAAAFPAFGALFLVGAFEHTVQTFSLSEVQGCEAPRNFIYNGFKTVQLPASLIEDAYRQLDEADPQ